MYLIVIYQGLQVRCQIWQSLIIFTALFTINLLDITSYPKQLHFNHSENVFNLYRLLLYRIESCSTKHNEVETQDQDGQPSGNNLRSLHPQLFNSNLKRKWYSHTLNSDASLHVVNSSMYNSAYCCINYVPKGLHGAI